MFRNKRLITVLLCIVYLLHFILPTISASQLASPQSTEIIIDDSYAAYLDSNSEYDMWIVLDTTTNVVTMSLTYTNNADYAYDYVFEFDSNNDNIEEDTFWNNLILKCFNNRDDWNTIYLPDAISTISDNGSRTTSSVANEMINYLEDDYGTPEYTEKVITSGNRGGINILLYEDLNYSAGKRNGFFVSETITIVLFIKDVLHKSFSAALYDLLCAIVGGIEIVANSTVQEYYMLASWDRYTKREASSVYLTNTHKQTVYTAYVYNDEWEVFDPLTETVYSNSATYFNSPGAQFDAAYEYYLTLQ